jgi:hypothetical protein
MVVVHSADPHLGLEEATSVAWFLPDPDDDTVATVANVDVFVDLAEGSSWSLMIFTVDEALRASRGMA